MNGVKNKKLISLVVGILSFFLLCGFVLLGINLPRKENNGNVSAWSGSGTESSPYLIKTITHLETLAEEVAGGEPYYDTYFRLDADIDFNGDSFCPIGASINSSGVITQINAFGGIFDGNGHVVSNMHTTINGSNSYGSSLTSCWFASVGFFAALGSSDIEDMINEVRVATVKNLLIKNYKITTTYDGYVAVGGIAGQATTYAQRSSSSPDCDFISYGAKIEKCGVDGLEVNLNSTRGHVGGLVGAQRALGEMDIPIYQGPETTRTLYVNNCMVFNYSVLNGASGTLKSVFSPAYGVRGINAQGQYMTNECDYYYDIRYSITDNNTYTTIMGTEDYVMPALGFSVGDCKIERPSSSIVNYSYDNNGCLNESEFGSSYYSEMVTEVYSTKTLFEDDELFEDNEFADSWMIDSSTGIVYQEQFLTTATVSVSSSGGGTVKENAGKTASYYIPKGDIPYKNSNKISFFKLYGNYIYNFTATANSGYKFNRWAVTNVSYPIEITAYFTAANIEIHFSILADITNASYSINGGTETKITSYYQATLGTAKDISISYDPFGKSGCYKICRFTFTNSNNQTVVVKYEITDTKYYIKGNNLTSSSSITISSTTTNKNNICVTTQLKSYNIEFN